MRTLSVVLLSVLSAVVCGTAQGETHISGDITSDQHWTKLGSPYIIHGEVGVAKFVTLVVDAGVVVKLEPGQTLIGATGGSTVSLEGTASEPILFTSAAATPAPGDYEGVFFGESGATFTAQHCIIEYGHFGLAINAPVSVVDVTIRHCVDGVAFTIVNGAIEGLRIVDNTGNGALGIEMAATTFRNCVISRNGGDGIHSYPEFSFVGADACIIEGNGGNGIFATSDVRNSVVRGNGGYGILALSGSVIEHNTIAENGFAEIGVYDVLPDQTVRCNRNNISDDEGLLFEVGQSCYVPTIDATGNYWGTSNATVIAGRIWDNSDDPGLFTLVQYIPFEGAVATQAKTWGAVKREYFGRSDGQ